MKDIVLGVVAVALACCATFLMYNEIRSFWVWFIMVLVIMEIDEDKL